MAQLDERKLDPAVALASLDATAPREPHRLFAVKQGDCFAVADAYGDSAAPATASSVTTPECFPNSG